MSSAPGSASANVSLQKQMDKKPPAIVVWLFIGLLTFGLLFSTYSLIVASLTII